MHILFDHGTPRGIARALTGHPILTAYACAWDRLGNGALLREAEHAGMDVLLTTDQQLRCQQNLADRKIAIVALTGTNRWSRVRLHLDRIAAAINAATPGSYAEVMIPFS